MGKKKKKGAKKDPEAILARAERLFQKGNYLLAEREFEKAGEMLGRENLHEKIEICRQEITKSNAKDLLKRAKKLARDGNPRSALACFEEAYDVLKEDWILKKIERLKDLALSLDTTREARDTEASGQYLKAARLYEQVFINDKNEDLILKQADCFIKAEDYEKAVSALERISLKGSRQWYDYGFSLARTGKYCQCLKAWGKISSQDERFVEQKALICDLLVSELYDRFEREKDLDKVYNEGKYLMDSGFESAGLPELMKQCALSWIETLWKEEQYETILGLLADYSMSTMDAALLQLRAKVSFKLTEQTRGHVEDLAMFWLSAVFSGDLGGVSREAKDNEAVRNLLVQRGEDLIKRCAKSNGDAAEKILAEWTLEKTAVENLYALARERGKSGLMICTPSLAEALKKSNEIVSFIRKNRDFFKNREQYLMTGCCYSPAWKSFSFLSCGEYEKAVEILPAHVDGDAFVDYGIGRVLFAYGLFCMENGERPPDRYAQSVANLMEAVPEYENQLVEKALDVAELDLLRAYEEALHELHARRPSKSLDDALSLVMSRRALEMSFEGLINNKVLTITLKKALAINPENEHARGLLDDAGTNQELIELEKALDRFKMNRACKIARETGNDEVRKAFFQFFEHMLEELEETESSVSRRVLIFKDIYKWCARVDGDHDILYDIEEMLEQIEEGQRNESVQNTRY
ncbi:MAG: hypothetical protein MUO68_02150 [Desulfobacteraceae bacterium]|nr:hypothetical protein [Desulfobacteraceae bacterium]